MRLIIYLIVAAAITASAAADDAEKYPFTGMDEFVAPDLKLTDKMYPGGMPKEKSA